MAECLTEFSSLYLSSTLCNILAVPNKAVFCISPMLYVYPKFSRSTCQCLSWHVQQLLSLQAQLPHAEVSTIYQNLSSIPDTSLSFLFLLSYSCISWHSNINYHSLLSFPVRYKYVCFSCFHHIVTLNGDIPRRFHSLISAAPSGTCSHHFSVQFNPIFLQSSQIYCCHHG